MELKPGYKQTEVGVIPEDWNCVSIQRAASSAANAIVGGPFGSDLTSSDYVDSGVPVVRGTNMGSRMIGGSFVFVSTPKAAALSANLAGPGDVVFTQRGTLGQVSLVPDKPFKNYLISQSQMKVSLDSARHNPEYVYYYFSSPQGQKQILDSAIQTGVPHTNLGICKKYIFPAPNIAEQSRICGVLKDIDSHIESIDRLLEKKRQIKQAAMQELLTGKRRLPGFDGEWEAKSLGSAISDLEAGVSVVSLQGNDQPSTGRYVLKTSAVTNGQLIASESKEIAPADLSRAKTSIRKNDLIISRMNTPSLVGECGYSESDYPHLFLPDRLWRVSYRNPATVSSRWLAYLLSYDQNKARIKELATGTSGSMKNISKHALLSLRIQWPTLAEQLAIADCLSSLNNEIKTLNAKIEKTRSLKQGVMQELLTGRIRLQ